MKEGIDYFPLDVVLDEKIRLIEADHGLKGFAIVVKLLQMIYREHGYYCGVQDDVVLLFARECGVGGSTVTEIINASIKRGLFDATLYEKYRILTSAGVQKRYFEAVSRRRSVKVKKEYLLVSHTLLPKNAVFLDENDDKNDKNVCKNAQSRVKEITTNTYINYSPSCARAREEQKIPDEFAKYYRDYFEKWCEEHDAVLPESVMLTWYQDDIKSFGEKRLRDRVRQFYDKKNKEKKAKNGEDGLSDDERLAGTLNAEEANARIEAILQKNKQKRGKAT